MTLATCTGVTPQLSESCDIKLNFIAAVNGRGGLVWLDFVSGTTDPVRRIPEHSKEFIAVDI